MSEKESNQAVQKMGIYKDMLVGITIDVSQDS